jgi:hypothetical protein
MREAPVGFFFGWKQGIQVEHRVGTTKSENDLFQQLLVPSSHHRSL